MLSITQPNAQAELIQVISPATTPAHAPTRVFAISWFNKDYLTNLWLQGKENPPVLRLADIGLTILR